MRTRFHIEKRRDGNGRLLAENRPVLMSVTFGGNRIIIGTGVKVDMNGWDSEQQRIQASYPESRHLNSWLSTMEVTAGRTMEALEHSGREPDPENFRQLFRQLRPRYSSGFFNLFFEFMESNGFKWSRATYQKIRRLYDLLRELEDGSGIPITFQSMDEAFLERFTSFCRERGYRHTTTYKALNNLVWFLNWASDMGYNVYRDYRRFYKLMDPPEAGTRVPVYLQWSELLQLMEYRTENRRKERVRDVFCFMCFSGIRFTELQRLKRQDFKDGKLHVKKPGGGKRIIPLNKYALGIHEKYANRYYLDNAAFPLMTVVTLNKYLRLIGRETGLERQVYSDTDEPAVPLCNCLTAGIAVNTFIRNSIELEIPVELISMITGIQKDSRLHRIKSELAAREMNKFSL